jgi:glycosyltransferase involved in cell wall biosynthesis
MRNSVFSTNTKIDINTGGGIVCLNIIRALEESTNLKSVISDDKINPKLYGINNEPFLYDYFNSVELSKLDYDMFVTYGAPFGISQKINPMAENIVDIAPHNIKISKEEHGMLLCDFSYPHLNNDNLHKIYMNHVINADKVIVHSKSSGEYIKELLGVKDYIVIPHGCEVPSNIIPFNNNFIVGHLGTNGPDKGQVYLTNAIDGTNLSLLVAGIGTNVYGGLGQIKDKNYIFHNCTVYVQPSVTEGFGIPVLEAMACNRPAIVAEGAGVSELITNGKDGFVVPIRDPNAIREKIFYFRDNPSEVIRMGMNARETALKYTWSNIREMYKEVFK